MFVGTKYFETCINYVCNNDDYQSELEKGQGWGRGETQLHKDFKS